MVQERHLLVDLQALSVIPKETLPDENQFPNESRKVWEEVTDLIHVKEWGKATRVKQGIEGKQRKDAATRKERNEEWVPKYFVWEEMGGRATLTDAGREMLETVYEEQLILISRSIGVEDCVLEMLGVSYYTFRERNYHQSREDETMETN